MKKIRNVVAVSLAVLLVAMSACQAAGPSAAPPASQAPASAANQAASQAPASQAAATATPVPTPEPPYVITMLCPFYQQEPPKEKDNPVLELIEKETNVDLQMIWVPNGEMENKFNILMAGNDMTMVMNGGRADSSNFIRMAQTGAFWDITEPIKDFPTITSDLMNPTLEKMSMTGGVRYIIPFNVPDARIGMLYRADWVENLGITLPEVLSVQDFYDLCKAFTENDPDGDGKKNTSGYAYCDDQNKEIMYGFNTLAVGMGAPNFWDIRDGKAVPYFDTEEYMNTLKLMADMYKNGYLVSEFATLGSGAKYNPILEGRAGIMFTTATNVVHPGGKFDTLIATNPKARMDYKLLLLDPQGNKVVNSNITGVAGGIVLTKAKVKTEADVRRILQFFVEANQGECAKAIDIGIKDKHYSVGADGKITVSDDQKALRTSDGSQEIFASIIPRRVMAQDWGQPLTETQKISLRFIDNQQYAIPDPSSGRLSAESLKLQTELEPLIIDARVGFIMGRIDEAGFKKAVQTWKDSGGNQIIEDLSNAYK